MFDGVRAVVEREVDLGEGVRLWVGEGVGGDVEDVGLGDGRDVAGDEGYVQGELAEGHGAGVRLPGELVFRDAVEDTFGDDEFVAKFLLQEFESGHGVDLYRESFLDVGGIVKGDRRSGFGLR